ncbi:unnamed protein product [Prunus armeniaca]
MIAQELMHKFKLAKGKKGMFAWKIDLSKAYDRLNWGFIESVLLEVGFPTSFIQLIMQCVSIVRYHICINGELTDPFSPSNGIRQGDPLSPYLFVLCIEKLSHIIVDVVKRKLWYHIKTSQNGPSASHLFFADDLMLFVEATPCQAHVMKDCLDLFCSVSGQTVNFAKSAIFCSPNTYKVVAKEIGSPLTKNLEKIFRIQETANMNRALLAKIGWRMRTRDQGHELKFMKGNTPGVSKQDCSATWRSVLYGVELLRKGMVWRVGNGDKVNFWKDHWVADLPLLHYAGVQSGIYLDCKVSNFFKEGWWDVEKLRTVLDEDMVQKITCFPVGFEGKSQDAHIWRPTSNGIFTVKSAFQLIHGGSNWYDACWKGLWSMSLSPKLKVFLWLVFQGKILTNEQRVRRHLALDSSCSICGWHSENIIHTLKNCGRAKELCGKGGPFGIPCLFSLVGMYGSGVTNTFLMMLRNVPRTQVMLRWEPPRSGCVKLNVDGTCMNASGKIGAYGVIRDCFREWCGGFAVNLGKSRILDAEIWGLLFGLRLAVAKGFTKILIEMDSHIAVNLFQQRGSLCFHPLAALLSNCEKMLMQFESWNIQHIFKEKNGLADCLAKWGHNLDLDIQFFVSTPIWASFALADDLLGVT